MILAALASAPLAAQERRQLVGRHVVIGPAELHPPPNEVLDLPMPPRDAFAPSLPQQPRRPLPVGKGKRPAPESAETAVRVQVPARGASGCDLVGHRISAVKPPGAIVHTVAEPSVAFAGTTPADADTAFYTGNRFAARSDDGGQTWVHVDPYTRFPNIDGGFCCDQRTLYIPSADITVWQLLYLPDALKGSNRIAISVGRDGLRGDVWHSYVVHPQQFGFPTGYWFDFPDIACSDHHLYFATNVITPTPWTNVDSIVMKFPLDELKAGAALNTTWWTRGQTLGDGPNFRFAQGSTHTMYMATHIDTTTLRTFQNPDSSATLTFQDHTIASWTDTGYVSLLSNGVNWTARANLFIEGGYARDDEYGFLWTAAAQTGRPLPYLRIVRFRTSDDALIGEEDLWSSSTAYAYPATTTNAVGDIGMVFAAGGATLDPASLLLIVDDCRPTFTGLPIFGWAFSTHGPAFAGWGDYFSMQRHPVRTLGFVASGMAMQGGDQPTDQTPRFLHYGRTRDDLSWTSVIVTSKGVSGVPIQVQPTDQLGKTSVVTPGYVSYLPEAAPAPAPSGRPGIKLPRGRALLGAYALTAPASFGGKQFSHWRRRSSPTGKWMRLPDGRRLLGVPSIGVTDETAEAVYH